MDIPKPDGPDINISAKFLAVAWTFAAIAIAVVVARIWSQCFIIKKPLWSDLLMGLALLTCLAETIMLSVASHYGFGRHLYYVPLDQRPTAIFLMHLNEVTGIISGALGRLSFTLLLWKLFGSTKGRQAILLFIVVETIVINLMVVIIIYAQCQDVRSLWNPIKYPSKCLGPEAQTYPGYIQTSTNAATDLALAILPFTVVQTLKLDKKMKGILIGIFSVSIIAFVASVVKATLITTLGSRGDYTFNTVNFYIWTNLEISLVIICGSVPLLRPIFYKPKRNTTSYNLQNYAFSQNSKHMPLSSGRKGSLSERDSSENILSVSQEQSLPGNNEKWNRVQKTTEVSVTYEDRGPSSNGTSSAEPFDTPPGTAS